MPPSMPVGMGRRPHRAGKVSELMVVPQMKNKLTVFLILLLAAFFGSQAFAGVLHFGERRTTLSSRSSISLPVLATVTFGRLDTINTVTMATTGCQGPGFSRPAWDFSGRPVIGASPEASTSGTKGIGARKSASTAASITATATSAQASPADVGRGACSGITRSSRPWTATTCIILTRTARRFGKSRVRITPSTAKAESRHNPQASKWRQAARLIKARRRCKSRMPKRRITAIWQLMEPPAK
jgi:hypothetical protein